MEHLDLGRWITTENGQMYVGVLNCLAGQGPCPEPVLTPRDRVEFGAPWKTSA